MKKKRKPYINAQRKTNNIWYIHSLQFALVVCVWRQSIQERDSYSFIHSIYTQFIYLPSSIWSVRKDRSDFLLRLSLFMFLIRNLFFLLLFDCSSFFCIGTSRMLLKNWTFHLKTMCTRFFRLFFSFFSICRRRRYISIPCVCMCASVLAASSLLCCCC